MFWFCVVILNAYCDVSNLYLQKCWVNKFTKYRNNYATYHQCDGKDMKHTESSGFTIRVFFPKSLQKNRIFTNSPQYNANIAHFILAVPLERNWTNEVIYTTLK